jgi:hypothetical protein
MTFEISPYNHVEMTFDEALRIVHSGQDNKNDLLGNLKSLQSKLQSMMNEDEFEDDWCYEISAFNKVCTDMSKLFV